MENKALTPEASMLHSVVKKQEDTVVRLQTGRSGGQGNFKTCSRQQQSEKNRSWLPDANVQASSVIIVMSLTYFLEIIIG